MMRPGLKLPLVLGWATAALMTLAAGLGAASPAVYHDPDWVLAAWLGSDLVSLLVAVPLLVTGLVLTKRGSVRGELLVYASFAYSLYGYAYYLFGASLNLLLPVYVALVVLPLIGLATGLGTADLATFRDALHGSRIKLPAAYMAFIGVGLASAWLAQWGAYVFGGQEPSVGVEAFGTIAALDLSLIVPFMVIGGILLWRGRAWGFVLGAIYTVKGTTYTLALTVGSAVGAMRGIAGTAGQIPVWGAMSVLGAAAAVVLLGPKRHRP